MWTAIIAFVFFVMFFSILEVSIVKSLSFISTNFGTAPTSTIAETVANAV